MRYYSEVRAPYINNEWIYGDLLYYADTAQIWQDSDLGKYAVSVVPETLGQYTGLTDKNGVKIFEGDIVSLGDANYPVIFNTLGRCAEFALTDGVPFGFDYIHVPMEVVGNIYDNPELIGGGENDT